MGKNYAQKQAAQHQQAQQEEALTSSLIEVAEQLQSFTKFSDFVIAGHGSTLLSGDTIFGYTVEEDGDRVRVLKTENQYLEVGDFVHLREVSYHAANGGTYFPSGKLPLHIENKRVEIFELVLNSIAEEGGHKMILKAMEENRLKKEAEAKDLLIRKEAEANAGRIIADIENGTLLNDPLLMLVPSKHVRQFAFVIEGSPMVFRTCYKKTGGKKNLQSMSLLLTDAPLGSNGFGCGTFVPLANLFEESHSYQDVSAMAKAIIGLFGDKLEEAKRLVSELAVSEGRPIKVLPMTLPDDELIPDISVEAMVNYFRRGEVPAGTAVH